MGLDVGLPGLRDSFTELLKRPILVKMSASRLLVVSVIALIPLNKLRKHSPAESQFFWLSRTALSTLRNTGIWRLYLVRWNFFGYWKDLAVACFNDLK